VPDYEAGPLLDRVLDLLRCRDNGAFLRRLAAHHAHMGFGTLATRPEKVSRWKSGAARPDRTTEAAMMDMLQVPVAIARAIGWPHWLRLALPDDRLLLTAPWTPAGTLDALDQLEGPDMDRRAALLAGGLVAAALTQWAATTPTRALTAHKGQQHVTPRTITLIEQRLATLRLLDDEDGSARTYRLARADRSEITQLLRTATYGQADGRRLFAAAAEASRLCGWTAFDNGAAAEAERHYLAGIRAASSAGDPALQANILSFWAMARYSQGDTSSALALTDAALEQAVPTGSARMVAMVHARASRAHATAGDEKAARRAEEAAFAAYEDRRRGAEDPGCVYWVTKQELHSWAASNAIDLGDPRRALSHYRAQGADTVADTAVSPRSAGLRLAREAKALLALDDVEAAADTAQQAGRLLGDVTSPRGAQVLKDLHTRLTPHRRLPCVQDVLSLSA
jgi:tetratricopeptide (TPR) repeat protein